MEDREKQLNLVKCDGCSQFFSRSTLNKHLGTKTCVDVAALRLRIIQHYSSENPIDHTPTMDLVNLVDTTMLQLNADDQTTLNILLTSKTKYRTGEHVCLNCY